MIRYEIKVSCNEAEKYKIRDVMNIEKLKSVLWDFDQKLRSIAKYGPEETKGEYDLDSDEAYKARHMLWEFLSEEGITSEDLG